MDQVSVFLFLFHADGLRVLSKWFPPIPWLLTLQFHVATDWGNCSDFYLFSPKEYLLFNEKQCESLSVLKSWTQSTSPNEVVSRLQLDRQRYVTFSDQNTKWPLNRWLSGGWRANLLSEDFSETITRHSELVGETMFVDSARNPYMSADFAFETTAGQLLRAINR